MKELLFQGEREEIGLVVVLWRQLKSRGRFDPSIAARALELARHLGVEKEYEANLATLAPSCVAAGTPIVQAAGKAGIESRPGGRWHEKLRDRR